MEEPKVRRGPRLSWRAQDTRLGGPKETRADGRSTEDPATVPQGPKPTGRKGLLAK